MRQLKAVIIDDETKGAKTLEMIIQQHCPQVVVEYIAYNALEGIKAIREYEPEIVFLDIRMPVNSGFEVLEHIDASKVFVIFTTAHEEYALQALRERAFDYLLKPIDPEELQQCIARVSKAAGERTGDKTNPPKNLSVPVKEGLLIIKQDQILRIEASGSYSYIFLTNGEKHIVSKSLKELEEQLDGAFLFRCHNSHIVNTRMVKKFIKTDGFFAQLEDGSTVEISRAKKDEFIEKVA
jgi:two-component system LytT family response regulator